MSLTKSLELRFFDQSYQEKVGDLELFIQASAGQISFAYFDPYQKQFVGLEDKLFDSTKNWHQLSEELLKIFEQSDHRSDFKAVSFALVDKNYTLVPSSLFDESKVNSYLNLNFTSESENSLLRSYSVNSLGIQLVYALPEILKKSLEKRFKRIDFLPYTAPLLESFSLSKSIQQEVQLNIRRDTFDILVSSEGKLQFLNSFAYNTVEDFIYYLLYVFEQLELNRDHISLKLSGDIDEKSSLYETLFKYIRHPELTFRPKEVKYSQSLNNLPLHQFRNLFNQYLCA